MRFRFIFSIVALMCVFLAFTVAFCFLWINSLKEDINRLESEKNGLKIEIQRREEVAQNVREREKIVEKLVYKDKEVFDWTVDIGNTAVVNELRLQCKSCTAPRH